MTEKLFYEDPYKSEFAAKVTEVADNKVVLDRTYFYITAGGQEGDTGRIDGTRVIEVTEEGGKIFHVLEGPAKFNPGETVRCAIDWDRRYRIMRLHSSAHIVDHFVEKVFGELPRIGSHVGGNKARLDYAFEGRLEPEMLKKVEGLANEFIAADRPIVTGVDENRPGFRYWRCGDIDVLCGGTHVRNTKEIGKIRLRRDNIGKGKERVEIYLVV